MEKHFNNLTPAQAERLAWLLEELGEAQQCIGKILRHGYESVKPGTEASNRTRLEHELGDMWAALDSLVEAEDLNIVTIATARQVKTANCKPYLHHQT